MHLDYSNSYFLPSTTTCSRIRRMPDKPQYAVFAGIYSAELHRVWENDQRIPTVSSRRAWAAARNVNPSAVHAWWQKRKARAKKLKIHVPDEMYDMEVGIPPKLVVKNEEVQGPLDAQANEEEELDPYDHSVLERLREDLVSARVSSPVSLAPFDYFLPDSDAIENEASPISSPLPPSSPALSAVGDDLCLSSSPPSSPFMDVRDLMLERPPSPMDLDVETLCSECVPVPASNTPADTDSRSLVLPGDAGIVKHSPNRSLALLPLTLRRTCRSGSSGARSRRDAPRPYRVRSIPFVDR